MTATRVVLPAPGRVAIASIKRYAPEASVALYWFTFCLYETLASQVTVAGLFYPFYLGWALVLVVVATGPGVTIDRWASFWAATFLLATLTAWTRIDEGPSFVMMQRSVAYASCLLVAWQVRSRKGLDLILSSTIVTSVAVAVWVIVRSASAGFAVRAHLDVDPNVVTSYVAIGALVASSVLISLGDRMGARPRVRATVALLLSSVVATAFYASLLLASRGGLVAWAAAVAGLAWSRRRKARGGVPRTRAAVAVGLVTASSLGVTLLPGANAVVRRWVTDDTASGGHRFDLWRAVVTEASHGSWLEWVLGHGLESAAAVVSRVTPSLTAVHQAFLQIGFEMGLVGLASFAFLHLHLVRSAGWLREPYAGAVVAVVVFMLGTCLTLDAADAFTYWVVLGTCIATVTHAPRREVDA